MARSNNDNHKAGKQRDTRKDKQGSKQPKATSNNTQSANNTDKVKTHYHSPHAY